MRTIKSVFLVAVGLLLASVVAVACDFSFNYDQITAPVGTLGEIGVRVQKTHKNCTMEDPLDYQFAWENIQIIGETQWEEIDPLLYEKWFNVSLSVPGKGFLKISKTCSKEGYEDAVLPITVTRGAEDGLFMQALAGSYPFTPLAELTVESAIGVIQLDEGLLTVNDVSMSLPLSLSAVEGYEGETRVYYAVDKAGIEPLLLVSDGFFYRFDYLLTNSQ